MLVSGRVPLICGATDALIIFLIAAFCLASADSNPPALIKGGKGDVVDLLI